MHSKSEDTLFSVISHLPENFVPQALMDWMERYTDKRIAELKQQIVRDRWQKTELQKAAEQISNK